MSPLARGGGEPVIVRCVELLRLPAAQTLELLPPYTFSVWLLPEDQQDRHLRRVVLRGDGEQDRLAAPPLPDAVLLLGCRYLKATRGFVVTRLGRSALEWQEGERPRRLSLGETLEAGRALNVDPPGLERFCFSLDLPHRERRGMDAAVAASDWNVDNTAALTTPAGWRTPDVAATLEGPKATVLGWWGAVKARLAPYKTVGWTVLPYAAFTASGALLYTQSTREHVAAQEENVLLEAKLEAANQAATAGLASERSCLDENVVLATRVKDAAVKARAAAAEVLDLGATRQRATRRLGAALTAPKVLEADALVGDTTIDAVAAGELAPEEAPTPARVEACLAQEGVLQGQLPAYVLVWTPAEKVVCPDDYSAVLDGVVHAGRWGLSPRVADEFGVAVPGADAPLPSDPWSAQAFAGGLRAVHGAMLLAPVGGRAPVLPAQADLWALALFDAYNQLPSPIDGALDDTAEACIADLVGDVAAAAASPPVGQPVLPDLVQVASGKKVEGVQASPGCPWPDGVLQGSARRALLAAMRLASVPPPRRPPGAPGAAGE